MIKEIIKKTVDAVNPLQIGATIEGKVVARDRSSLYIDLGINGTGIIYGREFYAVKEVIKNLAVGDKVFSLNWKMMKATENFLCEMPQKKLDGKD
ncbi:MAG: hypothetical protein NTV36_01425 [Candidatus Staskawiczbacteria bacterium]|nr:hypothetical protein [Candidatus Staskawiczbacteria bacterium]